MQQHDSSHDHLLERIVVGDLPRAEPQARKLLESCGTCRDRLAELEGLQARLESAGQEEREGVAEAAAGVLAADQERRIRELVETRLERPRQAARRWRVIALAAAASV